VKHEYIKKRSGHATMDTWKASFLVACAISKLLMSGIVENKGQVLSESVLLHHASP
jgi:hypothetical protein